MNNPSDPRDAYISRVVQGKTFADVGGLWGTVNEKVSVAHQAGAASVAMVDAFPSDSRPWTDFRQRLRDVGISACEDISGDVCELAPSLAERPFQVVHCSGVLYHHPNPLMLLLALKVITSEYLILTSAVTQEVIVNEHGRFEIPSAGVLFVPALGEEERAVLKAYWDAVGARARGITEKVTHAMDDFGPWWWLPTPSAMEGMCRSVGFQVLDSRPEWDGNARTVLLKA